MMKKAYFIADLHLGATHNTGLNDSEKSIIRFLDEIKGDCHSLFLLGDILDYWFEYKYVVPRGYVRFFGKIAELSDAGINIIWLIGNHDIWIFDYLPSELGINVYDGMIDTDVLGTRFCLQHGDALGGTKKFRFLRKLFRNKLCQKIYSGIHPRFSVGFAQYCSKRSRKFPSSKGRDLSNTLEVWKNWCENRIKAGDKAVFFVFGHLHHTCEIFLSNRKRMIVLPPWLNDRGYGVFDGKDFKIGYYDCRSESKIQEEC